MGMLLNFKKLIELLNIMLRDQVQERLTKQIVKELQKASTLMMLPVSLMQNIMC